jgi:2,4-dienoyl-CoA reductase-like NADH-dependent reductase (Old Yellow Enzyme family)
MRPIVVTSLISFFNALTILLMALFSPLRVKGLKLRNRIMCSPCELNASSPSGYPSKAYRAHYVDLARGECGLIVPGANFLTLDSKTGPTQNGVHTAEHIDAWRGTIADIHSLGSKVIFQVVHGGPQAVPKPINPADLSESEIDEITERYAICAERLRRAGADGIMIHAAHGYLISSFLSPFANARTDKYGGSLENRARLLTNIASELRRIDRKDFLIACKINGSDLSANGVTPAEIAAALKLAKVDLAEISCGGGMDATIRSRWSRAIIPKLPPGAAAAVSSFAERRVPLTEGYTLEFAKVVKAANPGTIVASVGGFKSVDAMKEALKSVDLVSLGRPFIREPDLCKKLRSGQKEVECVRCGQCILLFREVAPVRCFLKEGYLK